MDVKLQVICACLILLPGISSAAPTTYTYTGNYYGSIENSDPPAGTYTTAMRVTGTVTFPGAAVENALHYPADTLSFSFNDGRVTYTKDNTDPTSYFAFGMIAPNNIYDWAIKLHGADSAHGLFTSVLDSGGMRNPTDISEIHSSWVPQTDRGIAAIQGNWTITPVPEPAAYAFFLAGLALVALGAKLRMQLLTWRNPLLTRQRNAKRISANHTTGTNSETRSN